MSIRSGATACTVTIIRIIPCTTAMLTAENIATGTEHDVWSVNVEEVYHETSDDKKKPADSGPGTRGTGRDAPVISREHYPADHPVNKAK